MPEPVSPTAVASVVAEATGVAVVGVRTVAGSVGNQNFLVDLADGSGAVLKSGPGDLLAAEAWALRALRTTAVPVPPLLAHQPDADRLGLPYLIIAVVAGGPSERPAVLRSAGVAIRALHAVAASGFGDLRDGCGRFGSWSAVVADVLADVPRLVEAGVVEAGLGRRATARVDASEVAGWDGPGVLLHTDLKPQHLFGDGDRLVAVIDWGDVSVGDPRRDLARMSMAGPAAFAAFLDGYGDSDRTVEDEDLRAYRLLLNLDALRYELDHDGDWFAAYRDRIAADLASRAAS